MFKGCQESFWRLSPYGVPGSGSEGAVLRDGGGCSQLLVTSSGVWAYARAWGVFVSSSAHAMFTFNTKHDSSMIQWKTGHLEKCL